MPDLNRLMCVAAATAMSLAAACTFPDFSDPHPPPLTLGAPLDPFTDAIEGTTLSIEMTPVPIAGDPPRHLWVSRTEITWDLYDVFVYGLDKGGETGGAGADATARPSKPYVAMDRGFGHNGYPVISVSFHGAQSFCRWLSVKTGRRYRLPTEQEWKAVCRLSRLVTKDLQEHLEQYAWFEANSDRRTHPVGTSQADGNRLYDLLGNASEWCVGDDGQPVTLGGTYRDPAGALGCDARVPPTPEWNASDPQFPKSVWWLADAGFVGFRVVCEKD